MSGIDDRDEGPIDYWMEKWIWDKIDIIRNP
jgi:hypothetical protein